MDMTTATSTKVERCVTSLTTTTKFDESDCPVDFAEIKATNGQKYDIRLALHRTENTREVLGLVVANHIAYRVNEPHKIDEDTFLHTAAVMFIGLPEETARYIKGDRVQMLFWCHDDSVHIPDETWSRSDDITWSCELIETAERTVGSVAVLGLSMVYRRSSNRPVPVSALVATVPS
jgi:hypothetical protein